MTSKIASLPTIAKRLRSKSARKKTPRKIILEPAESTDNSKQEAAEETETIIDAGTFDKIKETDVKFKNKRSKLESLLSTIKDKLNVSNPCDSKVVKEETVVKDDRTDNKKLESESTNHESDRTKPEAEVESNDDISFVDISQQDKECLKHLENMEIPIEGCDAKRTDGIPEARLQNGTTNAINLTDRVKVLKTSKNLPKFHTNRKVTILNIKKIANGTQKMQQDGKSVSAKSILKVKSSTEKLQTKRDKKPVHQLEKANSDIDQTLPHENATENAVNCKNNVLGLSSVEKLHFRSEYVNEESNHNTEDFLTIFKIVTNTNETKNTKYLAEEKGEIKEEPAAESDVFDREAKTLDSYYKKCKSRKRESNKSNNAITEDAEPGDIKQRREDIRSAEETKELCDSCDKDSKMSIIVPSTTDVRYCLKCSSIFDLEECDYCKRKEREKHKILEQESKFDVRIINVQNSVNRHYV